MSKKLGRLFRLTFSIQKSFYVLSSIRAIINAIKTLVGVYGLSLIVQSLIDGNMTNAISTALLIVAAEVILRFFEITLDTNISLSRKKLNMRVKSHLIEKMMSVEYKYLEDPDYLVQADKARFAIDNFSELNTFLNNVIGIINSFVIMCSLLTIIILFNPIIIAIVIINVLLHTVVAGISVKKQKKLYAQLGPVNRKLSYFREAVRDVRFQKDYRIYPLGDLVYDNHDKAIEESCSYLRYFTMLLGRFEAAYFILNAFQLMAIYMFIAYISIQDGLGVSTYILLTASAVQAANAIDGFAGRIIQTKRNIILLEPVFGILNTEDAVTMNTGTIACTPLKSLKFKHVTFSYPGSDQIVLDNISFQINKGEKVSIVGLNGAGKTTIVKLISRFFIPTSGEILWNDININDYEYYSYIEQLSAVFQDFKLFQISIKDNVELHNPDDEKVRECLYKVGLEEKIESLPNNIDSFLSKEYSPEGVELSGGERQKVAIARAMYKNSSLTILDEPTSALDPISEAEIYEHFKNLVKDKTTIYISHRMSSSVFCDKIIVIDGGTVSAIDTHQNLMKKQDGMYYQLFHSQSNYYQ